MTSNKTYFGYGTCPSPQMMFTARFEKTSNRLKKIKSPGLFLMRFSIFLYLCESRILRNPIVYKTFFPYARASQ